MSFSRQVGLDSYFDRGSFSKTHTVRQGALTRNVNSMSLKLGANSQGFRQQVRENGSGVQSFRVFNLPKSKSGDLSNEVLSRNSFKFHMVVGKGGFGKVWIVTYKSSKKYLALKEMSKARIISKKSVHSVMNEKQILCSISHPFIVNIKSSFQDRQNLYLVMDLVTGGDLRFHICYMRRFTEEQTKFFVACIVLALDYVHSQGFLHRDIKPENIVFDEKGYLRVTDFGISRKWSPDNGKETSGTPGYMAPEVMCRMQHSFESDYYAVGVIVYECMTGRRPYDGKSRKEIRDQILARQESIKPEERPKGWSLEAIDFVNRMIARKPHKRLGFNGISEVMNHPWFKGFRWDKLKRKELEPPFTPNVREVFDYLRTLSEDSTHTTEVQDLDFNSPEVKELFSGYSFNNQDAKFRASEREKTSREKPETFEHRKHTSSPSKILKPLRASQSPKKLQKVFSRNYASMNAISGGFTHASSRLMGSKDLSLFTHKASHTKSKKENVLRDSKGDGGMSNRTHDLASHSRLRAASDNLPLQASSLASTLGSNWKR